MLRIEKKNRRILIIVNLKPSPFIFFFYVYKFQLEKEKIKSKYISTHITNIVFYLGYFKKSK